MAFVLQKWNTRNTHIKFGSIFVTSHTSVVVLKMIFIQLINEK